MIPTRFFLSVGLSDLSLSHTLRSGQTFRWRETCTPSSGWIGVVARTPFHLSQTGNGIECEILSMHQDPPHQDLPPCQDPSKRDPSNRDPPKSFLPDANIESARRLLTDYFQLGVSLSDLTGEWIKRDERMREAVERLRGLRRLRQEPFECLISFICSANNNVARIEKMVGALCERWGDLVAMHHGVALHAFPSPQQLEAATEADLRALGFGYRAKYIVETLQLLRDNGGVEWLDALRLQSRQHVRSELLRLSGVGRKVADCVALFSLDKFDIVPVDTHVWQIATRDYMPSLKSQNLTDTNYERIGDFFRDLHGPECGWAHSYLFASELPKNTPPKSQKSPKSPRAKTPRDSPASQASDQSSSPSTPSKRAISTGNTDKIASPESSQIHSPVVSRRVSPRFSPKNHEDQSPSANPIYKMGIVHDPSIVEDQSDGK